MAQVVAAGSHLGLASVILHAFLETYNPRTASGTNANERGVRLSWFMSLNQAAFFELFQL